MNDQREKLIMENLISRKKEILIVDDDPEACSLYERWITEALPGRRIIRTENGAAALAILEQETPSIVLLDLIMSGTDGFAVLERMRANPRTSRIPVLVLSGKLLTYEDIRRLDYSLVTFQTKGLLSEDESARLLLRALSGEQALPQPTSALVKHALAYLHQNFTNPLTRQEIAEAVGVSKNYLSEIFRQEIGISPWDCLARFRIQKAKELFITSSDSIASIANQVGFDDAAYFSRVFHKLAGVSPQKYRR
jgi:YesN/AraC family two-component response regulator